MLSIGGGSRGPTTSDHVADTRRRAAEGAFVLFKLPACLKILAPWHSLDPSLGLIFDSILECENANILIDSSVVL